MKGMTRNALFSLMALFLPLSLMAQITQYSTDNRTQGYWTLGLNGGLSYQQSDVQATLDGYGFGLTLGKNLYYKPGAPLIFDIRGRALYTQSYGLEGQRSYGINRNDALNGFDNPNLNYTKSSGETGFVFQNHKTHMGELGLEGVLTFNQLRERTNVILSVFGGIGIDWYKTNIDQLDRNGLYSDAYAAIDTIRSISSIRQNLKNNILDGNYETDGQDNGEFGKIGIMPSVGLELGYQLTPNFSIGMGHKVTFSRTDLLDGQKWENDNLATNDNDIHHYTNLHLRWIIQPKENRIDPPVIEIIEPFNNPYTTRDPNGFVRARISNIKSAMDVDFLVNGRTHRFDYRKGYLSSNILLNQGKNEVVITATNTAGQDRKKVIIVLDEVIINDPVVIDDPIINDPVVNFQAPEVEITQPYRNGETVEDPRFTIIADVRHVTQKRDITLKLNGKTIRSFGFSTSRGEVTANVELNRGKNLILIQARNKDGRAADEATIYYEKVDVVAPPIVRITKPYKNPHYTKKQREVIEAEIRNVDWKGNITYRVNGRKISEFDYGANVFCGNADLEIGANQIEIIAQNESGEAKDRITIYLEEDIKPVSRPPVVEIVEPARSTVTSDNDEARIVANIDYVNRKQDITFTINGQRSNDFSFNTSTGVLKANVDLRIGRNRVVIEGRNDDGRDQDAVNIDYEKQIVLQRPPQVSISQPRNNSSTENAKTDLTASVLHVERKSDIEVLLNGRRITDFSYSTSKKRVTARLSLREGRNTIRVKAKNAVGEDEASVTVTRTVVVVVNPPKVNIIRPSNKVTENAQVDLKAEVKNVKTKQDIQVFLNGTAVRNFRFNSGSRMVEARLTLRLGENKILVKASNKDGRDDDQQVIRYIKTVAPPVVKITSPKNNTTFSKAAIEVQARIEGVTNKNSVKFYLNGQSIKGFNFNRNRLVAKINLKNGQNTITIKATNEGGKDEASVRVKFLKPISAQKPVVKFVVPSRSGSTSKQASTDIKVKVLNVKSKKDISLKVGKSSVKAFNYNTRTKELTAKVKLNRGNNEIVVEASNEAGKASAKTTIKYVPKVVISQPKAPKIKTFSMTQPTANPLNPNTGKSQLTATFDNVTQKSEISLIVNGKSVSSFSFDPKSKKMSIIIALKKGSNTIQLKVRTAGGTDEETKEVNF